MMSTPISRGSAATASRMMWLSVDGTPAAGSSRSSTSGLRPSVIASSTSRWRPYGNSAMRWEASSASLRVSSSAIASSTTSWRRPAGLNMWGATPSRSATAIQTFSSTERPRNRRLIWKVRAIPSLTRSACATAVMSLPLNSTCPAVGLSTPVNRLISVVLPAPFGPISACRAPAPSWKSTLRVAASAPKLMHSCRVSRSGVVMAACSWRCAPWPQAPDDPIIEADDAVAREQRDQHQQQPEAELPGGRIELGEKVREREIRDGADEGAVEPAVASQHQDDQHGRGAIEAERAHIDIGIGLRPQAARDAGKRGRDRVAGDQPRIHRRADRVHAQCVLANAGQALAERRINERAHEQE